MRKTAAFLLAMGMTASLSLSAQTLVEGCVNQVGFGVHGGLVSLGDNVASHNSPGGAAGLQIAYAHLFTPSIGVATGLDLSYGRAFLSADNFTTHTTENITLSPGDVVRQSEVEYNINSISERYNITYIGIPVQVFLQGNAFDFSITQLHQSYVSLGIKVALPVSFKGSGSSSEALRSIGPDLTGTGVSGVAPMPMGTVAGADVSYDVKASMSPSVMLLGIFEAGTLVKTNENGALLASVFVEYSLSPHQMGGESGLFTADESSLTNNGYLASNLADKMKFFQFGIKLQYNLLLH